MSMILPPGRVSLSQLVEEILFFNSWEQTSSLSVHPQGLVFFMKSILGADH